MPASDAIAHALNGGRKIRDQTFDRPAHGRRVLCWALFATPTNPSLARPSLRVGCSAVCTGSHNWRVRRDFGRGISRWSGHLAVGACRPGAPAEHLGDRAFQEQAQGAGVAVDLGE